MSDKNQNDKLLERIVELEKENVILSKKLNNFRDIYNNTTIGLYRTDIKGKIINANPPLVKITDWLYVVLWMFALILNILIVSVFAMAIFYNGMDKATPKLALIMQTILP